MAEDEDVKVSGKQKYAELLARVDALEGRMTKVEGLAKSVLAELQTGRLARVCQLVLGNTPQ